MNTRAIGGYFELELPPARREYHQNALRFQSARAAFIAMLLAGKPNAVWMPWYICESMIEPLRTSGVVIKRYAINERFQINSTVLLGENEWLLYVNYFGLCDRNIDELLEEFPPEQIVIDNAQAFYATPRECLANIYSPRKFFGVPDGGYLVAWLDMPTPDTVDEGSIMRCSHLLKRLEGAPEPGYADYLVAEESLSGQSPMRMSKLTQRILSSIDYEAVQTRRRDNFAYLSEHLASRNQFNFDATEKATPLCYPFYGAPSGIREELIRYRVYTPSFWPEIARIPLVPAFEKTLQHSCLLLPCDQRLSKQDMDRMIEVLSE